MDIIMKGSKNNILIKDCIDFVPMHDGTIIGEKKYCDLSFKCRQIGYYSEYCNFFNDKGEVIIQDYLCTGQKVKKEEVQKDEEAH